MKPFEVRPGIRLVLAVGLALAGSLRADAQPVPVPRPSLPSPADAGPVPVPVPSPATAPVPADDPIAQLLASQVRQAPPLVIGLRLGEHRDVTRFVVELSDPVAVRTFTLTNPDRVVIDLPEVLWRINADARPSGQGAVKSYRYGLFRKGNSRFVIDLAKPVRVDTPRIYPPEGGYGFRLVIDLYPATKAQFASNAGWPKGDRTVPPGAVASAPAEQVLPEAVPPPPEPKPAGTHIVVVDPGHGGIDPGTHGATGLEEKSIVLAVAKDLRNVLEQRGRYKVVLTRDTDTFIPLRQRVEIARAAHADLFISLHVDSSEHRDIRGASIYTLSEEASDREAAKLADKENMSDVIAGVDLSAENNTVASILIDLAQRETINRSARFAETVLADLPAATLVRPTTPHRSAGFAVLKAPDVPAVLVELGYLSNPKDEAEMATRVWRQDVAEALANAIDAHFAPHAPVPQRQALNN